MPNQPVIVFDVNETLLDLEVSPQTNYVGSDLDEVADQLIARFPAEAV